MAKCVMCKKRISILNDYGLYQFSDGKICNACFEKIQTEYYPGFKIPAGHLYMKLFDRHSSELKEVVDEILVDILPDANYAVGRNDSFARFDDKQRKLAIPGEIHNVDLIKSYTVIDYDDIVSYELLEDGGAVMSGGIGRAAVGGLLFGGVGAIVGASTGQTSNSTCSNLQIKITLNNPSNPTHYFKLINKYTWKKTDSFFQSRYKDAQDICSKLDLIIRENEQKANASSSENTTPSGPTEELRKYKALLDDGIITQEDFNQKKKQILGL